MMNITMLPIEKLDPNFLAQEVKREGLVFKKACLFDNPRIDKRVVAVWQMLVL